MSKDRIPKYIRIIIVIASVTTAIGIIIPAAFKYIKPLHDLQQGMNNTKELWQFYNDSLPVYRKNTQAVKQDHEENHKQLDILGNKLQKLTKRYEADSTDLTLHLIDYYILKDRVNRNH